MKISIIGTGAVGTALGKRWSAMNHEITFGSRNPRSPKVLSLLKECNNSIAVDIEQAASHSDVIVLATPWTSALNVIEKL